MNGDMYGPSCSYSHPASSPYQGNIPQPVAAQIPVPMTGISPAISVAAPVSIPVPDPIVITPMAYGIQLQQCGSQDCHEERSHSPLDQSILERLSPHSGYGTSPRSSPMHSPRSSPGPYRRSHVLPPCKVCGAQATGFHYGVNTCEACKGFFRRSLLRKEEYICLQSNKCIMQPGKRNLCGYCRYQKCLEAGMSKEGIKTGRYTYEKRTKDILELKQIKREECQARNIDLKREKEERAIQLADKVMEVRNKHTRQALMDQAMTKLAKYVDEKHMLEEFFGEMKTVTEEDYIYAFENMGLELDNRREIAFRMYSEFNETWIPEMFSGLREVPGADQLTDEELTTLFKYSACDFWILSRHRLISHEDGCVTSLTGVTYELEHVLGKKAADDVLRMVKKLQGLCLRPVEVCLLMALSVFSTDRCEVGNRPALEHIQDIYLEALEILLPVNHPEEDHILAKVMQILVDLRTLTETVRASLRQITARLIDFKQFPLVHHILFT